MLVRVVAEITLPDGTVLHAGDVVETRMYPGLDAAIAAKATVAVDDLADIPMRTK